MLVVSKPEGRLRVNGLKLFMQTSTGKTCAHLKGPDQNAHRKELSARGLLVCLLQHYR